MAGVVAAAAGAWRLLVVETANQSISCFCRSAFAAAQTSWLVLGGVLCCRDHIKHSPPVLQDSVSEREQAASVVR